jgi:hypothetical protein
MTKALDCNPTKPTIPSFVGFVGWVCGLFSEIRALV